MIDSVVDTGYTVDMKRPLKKLWSGARWVRLAPSHISTRWAIIRVCQRMFNGTTLLLGTTHLAPGDRAGRILVEWLAMSGRTEDGSYWVEEQDM